jgi:tetratricopeptide (TPR) repeat protein
MQAGRTAEAAEQFRTLLVASPDVVPARLGLASLLLLQGRWQQAKVEYEVALRHGDTDGLAQGRLGYIVLHHEADPGGALNYYNEGVAVAGAAAERASLWVGRGVALRALGQDAAAERSYQQALMADSQHVEAWFNLGNLLRDSGRRPEAMEAYRRVLEFEPEGSLAPLASARIEQLASD